MITCPNCNHQNPDGALQCEACYTPLPAMVACPNCNTPVQADASFCGQCGNDLRGASPTSTSSAAAASATEVSGDPESALPTQNFLIENQPSSPDVGSVVSGEFNAEPTGASASSAVSASASASASSSDFEIPDLMAPDPLLIPEPIGSSDPPEAAQPQSRSLPDTESSAPPATAPEASTPAVASPVAAASKPIAATQLQTLSARLRHVQTDTPIEVPKQLSVVRIGKPNDQTPPDIDVSGFPDSEVVSRVHANLRVEGDVYYLEDVGSSNGTYVNGLPLAVGNRHRLRQGDRIALGKGDKISFIFETA